MPYTATVYRVFIASPGDVATEREIIRQVIADWNAAHALSRRVILEPVGWETHPTPAMGWGGPQNVISSQLLKDADILIGVFWNRLGTRTASHASGTAQEIAEHVATRKPAMIYFSDLPVPPSKIDRKQRDRLEGFRKSLEKDGLLWTYDSVSRFQHTLTQHLARTLNELRSINGTPTDSLPKPTEPDDTLSDFACQLLETGVKHDGQINLISASGGEKTFWIGGRWYGNVDTMQQWLRALDELRERGYLFEVEKNTFKVTPIGFRFIEENSVAAEE